MKELLAILNLHATKRRGEEVKESFDDLKSSFKIELGKLIESGATAELATLDKLPPFSMELFEKYTDFSYAVELPDKTIKEFLTLKELKESDLKESPFKFNIKIKEGEPKFFNFIYAKQWWKNKFMEGTGVNNFLLNTDYGIDFCFDTDIFDANFKEGFFYIKPNRNSIQAISESITFLKPKSELNTGILPSWIKKISAGTISVVESSELSKNIQIIDGNKSYIFTATRDSQNSDFWKLLKKT